MPWLTPGMRRGLLAVTCTGDWLAGAALKLGHLADAGWAATKMEKHKAENASMQMPVIRLQDTINGLQSDETRYDFIPYVWIQGQSFSRTKLCPKQTFNLRKK